MDVVLVRWPDDQERRAALAAENKFRLLLVDAASEAPIPEDLYEDWIRVPADEADVQVRIEESEDGSGLAVGVSGWVGRLMGAFNTGVADEAWGDLPMPMLSNPRVRFWFTERGWRAYGLRVAAEALTADGLAARTATMSRFHDAFGPVGLIRDGGGNGDRLQRSGGSRREHHSQQRREGASR